MSVRSDWEIDIGGHQASGGSEDSGLDVINCATKWVEVSSTTLESHMITRKLFFFHFCYIYNVFELPRFRFEKSSETTKPIHPGHRRTGCSKLVRRRQAVRDHSDQGDVGGLRELNDGRTTTPTTECKIKGRL